MCVICVASIPKHLPSKCPTEMVDNAYMWPSICYKCKSFIPIHDHKDCPNARSLTCTAKNLDNFVHPARTTEQEAVKIWEKCNRKKSLNSRKASFKIASDESVKGTTFNPQKTKKTFVQKPHGPNRPNLPPMSSFLQPMNENKDCNGSEASATCSAANTMRTPESNKSTSCPFVVGDNTGDFTLPNIEKTKNNTYTTKLDFDDLEEKRKCKGKPVNVNKIGKISRKFVRARIITVSNPSVPSNHLASKQETLADVKCSSLITNSDVKNKNQPVVWNDLSLIYPQESTKTAERNSFEGNDKENKIPEAQNYQVKPKSPLPRASRSIITLGSDSEADLYSSNDEEDVLMSHSFSRVKKLKDANVDVKPLSFPQIESPDSLSKKALSYISPIDEQTYDHRYFSHENFQLPLESSKASLQQSKNKRKKNGKGHQICNFSKKTPGSSSVLDDLLLSAG